MVTYGDPAQRGEGKVGVEPGWGLPGDLTLPTVSPTPVHGPAAQPNAQPLLADPDPASTP